MRNIQVRLATGEDGKFAKLITDEMEAAAIIRGFGISKRSRGSVLKKVIDGKGIIALAKDNIWAGFSYIEAWSKGEFVSNSGLIVAPAYRSQGIALMIKNKIFGLSRSLHSRAKIISITTGLTIMKMNARLGSETVTFNEIAREKEF